MPWARAVLERLPGVELFDAHVHVGISDPGGILATEAEALDALAELGSRALVFPLKEPVGYDGPNARMIELAGEHEGFAALARVVPGESGERWIDAGAAGLKLHPRGEEFDLDDPRLDDAFALADERRLPVMIHAGVGDPDLGDHAMARAREHPGARLILAHAAVGVFDQVLPHVPELENLYFDTSWWNPSDLWALFRLVPPSRILYASDIPFASPAEAVLLTGRLGLEAGLSEEQLRSVFGGQLERLVAREDPLDVGEVEGEAEPLTPELERVYLNLCLATERLLGGGDAGQGLDLVRAVVRGRDGLLGEIGELLDLFDAREDPDPLRAERTPGFDLVLAGAVLARTPNA
jgi:hypothetical protein